MHKLSAEFDRNRHVCVLAREYAATNAIARFQHHDFAARAAQLTSRGQTSRARADDDYAS